MSPAFDPYGAGEFALWMLAVVALGLWITWKESRDE